MRKICIAAILSVALLLGACGSAQLSGGLPESPASSAGTNEPGTSIETEKTSYDTSKSDDAVKEPDSAGTNVPQGITMNRIGFEVIEDNIPDELKAFIESNKANKGFTAREIDGQWYVVVFMGEQVTGGFNIKVTSIEDNEGKTNIAVNEEKPAEDAIVVMALTYPCQVVKITDGIAPNFKVVNQDGEEYPEVK